MGRHSRKGPAPQPEPGEPKAAGPGSGRRRHAAGTATETPPHGTPQYGTPPHGTPQHGTGQYGTPPHGTPQYGTPAHGTPQYGTPAHGTPAYGRAPGPYGGARPGAEVRGGHPEHPEGAPQPQRYGDWQGTPRRAAPQGPSPIPAQRHRPRPEDLAAFDADPSPDSGFDADEQPEAESRKGRAGRTLTGVAAAAVTTVLAVVVAGQVIDPDTRSSAERAVGETGRAVEGTDGNRSDRSDDRATPSQQVPAAPAVPAPPTYEQLMTRQFPIDPKLKGSGGFEAVPGFDKAPGKGDKIRYRVDVEKGLGLDPELFAQAVQLTLNDRRSWAGKGAMTFERISSGDPEFVITLASPGTTGEWCAKSGLDTTVDNVSCDSASTQRVMINAFRWAQGSETFGPKAMHPYRQMLINHEVGHRLGHGHVTCRTEGALAPVMQQQTKSLDIDGVRCRPNPWVHPGG
ncbi:DUF3152 domain-containing protein [Streptomyces sp. NPDC048604]|uniref:DUF3152 domain-containing protein n=1 Tax=Streptomyces sp. NPDC048604 TaxID=3365578 RepID=UPI0037186DF5